MKNEKAWSDINFNIKKLSRAVSSNTLYVSRAINSIGKTNFKDYINSYRLEFYLKNKKIMNKNSNFYMNLGFNNKKNFKKAFKSYLIKKAK